MQRVSCSDQELKSKEEKLEEAEAALRRAIARVVRLRVGRHSSFEEVERVTLEVTNEASRGHLERQLQQLADRVPAVFRFNGIRYHPHQPGTVKYHSLCGPLEIRRKSYRRIGVRNSPTIIPLEVVAEIVERSTPAFARCIAQGYAKTTSRDIHEDLLAAHRRPPSRTTLERACTRIAAGVRSSLDEIEPSIRLDETVPDEAVAIAIGLDRTSVPMAEDRPLGEPPISRRKRRRRPHRRKPPKPFDVNYRMAYAATVTLTNTGGEALTTYRYAVAAHEGPQDIVARAMADVRNALQQRAELNVGVILDAAPELWGLMWDALNAEPLVSNYHQLIDRYHLNERLSYGLKIIEPDSARRHQRLSEWNRRLDKSDRAILAIERELEDTAKTLSKSKRRDFEFCLDYVFGYSRRMRYATARRLGLPVGSGVTEGACKSLITTRTKRSGQHWRKEGISGVLALRSVHQSERFDDYWPRFVRWRTCSYLVS